MTSICGYAAIFDEPDNCGDIIRRGAFSRTLRVGIPVLLEHNPARQIGYVILAREDSRGLWIEAEVGDPVPAIKPNHGLSFAFRAVRFNAGRYRELLEVELFEVSLVKNPMHPRAMCMPRD